MAGLRTATILGVLMAIVVSGTVFFHHVEGWPWLDAYFFTVVTLSTVGYGELVPATAIGKIGTTVLIFTGLGVFAVAIQLVGGHVLHRHSKSKDTDSDGSGDDSGGDR